MRPTLRLFDGFPHTTPALAKDVRELQSLLLAKGLPTKIDGFFNMQTQMSVQEYQKRNKLAVTGIADANTWALLLGKAPAAVPPTPTTPTTPTRPQPVTNLSRYIFQTAYSRNDPALIKQLNELKKYDSMVRETAAFYGIPSAVVAGIGSRESAWGLALTPPGPGGTGDGGHGRGLLQVDDRWHVDFINSGKWANAKDNIIYGCALLKNFMTHYETKGGITDKLLVLQAAVAAYNAGPRRVLESYQAGSGFDFYTTGRNYSVDTLSRAGWFQLWGW